MTQETVITLAIEQQIATITLNRPDKRNAFNEELIAALDNAFTQLGNNPEVRAIILAAQGKAFCAGADLNWMRRMADYEWDKNLADATTLANMLTSIARCPKPTIAAVQGDVYAGGMGLVAACDMAVAAPQAGFCLSEVKIGLAPATIAPYVVRAMGMRAAQRYFLSAERFTADEALRIGFIHEISDDVSVTAQQWAQNLCTLGPQAVSACKDLLHAVEGDSATQQALIDDTIRRIADIRASEEGKEGIRAFLDKRRPNWLATQHDARK